MIDFFMRLLSLFNPKMATKSRTVSDSFDNSNFQDPYTPPETKKVSLANRIQALYIRHGAIWDREINIFGVRDTFGIEDSIFNDLICVVHNSEIYAFLGTTDPGNWWNKNMKNIYTLGNEPGKKKWMTSWGWGNKIGNWHVTLGFHKNVWKVGTHKPMGTYPALVNENGCEKFKCWSDIDEDNKKTNNDIIVNVHGINCHNANNASSIGKYAAGCQVIQKVKDFNIFMKIIMSSKKYKSLGNQARFSYMLFDKSNIPFDELKEKL